MQLTQEQAEESLNQFVSTLGNKITLAILLVYNDFRRNGKAKQTFQEYAAIEVQAFFDCMLEAIDDKWAGFHVGSNCEKMILRGLTFPQAANRLLGDVESIPTIRRSLAKTLRDTPKANIWGLTKSVPVEKVA